MGSHLIASKGVVPYTVAWSEEKSLPTTVIAGRFGIAYSDETLIDRDSRGVLWTRVLSRPGIGRPKFGEEHAVRQRKAMRDLLCQVCGQPADRTEQGVLWLLRDHREDWSDWPNNMANTYPPVCVPCARLSIRMCPALRKGHVAVRAHSAVSGVFGVRYRTVRPFAKVEIIGSDSVAYDDPAIRWTRASKLVRSFLDFKVMDIDSIL